MLGQVKLCGGVVKLGIFPHPCRLVRYFIGERKRKRDGERIPNYVMQFLPDHDQRIAGEKNKKKTV